MGEEYQDLVELGFEGIDRFSKYYHDHVYDFASKTPKWGWGKHKRQPSPPAPAPRARSEPRDRRASFSDDEDSRGMYVSDRRRGRERERERGWGDDGEGDRRATYGSKTVQRGYYQSPERSAVVVRDQDPYRYASYEVARRGPAPPLAYAQRDVEYDRWAYERGRPPPFRRPSSYSPPRERRQASPVRRRHRSKSPNHHRVAATIVGALAGGLIGNAAKHGSTYTTVGGAIAGGIAARKGEKWYDRHEEKKAASEERRARRREREREREREYDDGY